MSNPIVLTVDEWDTSAINWKLPKVSDKGGKSVMMISEQTKRMVHVATPVMTTFGISDFVNAEGTADGRFNISLIFPNDDYKNKQTSDFFEKIKSFQDKVLADAITNSELWFGEELEPRVIEHMMTPILKYSKIKGTKKPDMTKPPTIRAKVPNYNGKWGVEIYDMSENKLFPSENDLITPCDLVLKMSQVACVLLCSGIWIGDKGFSVQWKLVQCVVKPREIVSVFGKCHIKLSPDEVHKLSSQRNVDDDAGEDSVETESIVIESIVIKPKTVVPAPATVSTTVDDSDDEQAVPVEAAAPVVAADEAPKKKKIIRKITPVAST